MHSLPLFHRIAGARVVVVGEGDMAAAKARLVERAGGVTCAETEAHHARLAFVALEVFAAGVYAQSRNTLAIAVVAAPWLAWITALAVPLRL